MGLDDGQGVGTEAGETGILAGWGRAFARGFRQKATKSFPQPVENMAKRRGKGWKDAVFAYLGLSIRLFVEC